MKVLSDSRITGYNIFNAASALLYRRPLKFISGFFSKENLTAITGQLFNPAQSDELKALSAALGIFIGILPIWGVQTVLAVFISVALKLNKTLVVVFSLVSIPPLMPLIIFLSYRTGHYLTNGKTGHLTAYVLGSLVLALAAAAAVGVLTYIALKITALLKQPRWSAV